MLKANNKKICIVTTSLGGGGAERASAQLSEILCNIGYDVHIVSVLDNIEYNYKGKLLNLGELKNKNDSILGRLNRLKVFRRYLKANNFDYIIDNRTRIGFIKEFILSKFIFNSEKTIYVVHSYLTANYVNANRFLGKILYRSAYKIITVSKTIEAKLKNDYNFKNTTSVYNAVNISAENYNDKNEKSDDYILFFGRLEDRVKNISLLLESYAISNLPKHKVPLKILGKGKDLEMLKSKANTLGISSQIEYLSYNPNPYQIVKSSLFTVLTSRYEGFPMVIPESLVLGTPVISVDCKSGPNEIITNEFNGLLVENHNPEALAKAMNRLFEDKDLYLHCKQNSIPSVAHFSEENIVKEWQSILK